ncbi:MAG: isopentenyl phosphate kinase family protein [Candidatus Aenigmarchaeota archaeon]|nr:isopentenyl phosphate kinase family protein [Candidatus Aenigmarchaeota archaeon]
MKRLVFVKLGGSLITDKSKPYTTRDGVIKRLCKEIHEGREGKPLLIGHGGGSFPHVSASRYETHKGVINEKSWEGFVKVQNDAATLNRIVVSSLIEAGENAISIQPSASCIARNDSIIEWYTKPIETSLSKGLIPVPYGDVCIDEKKGCCIISTEEIFRFLAKKLKPERIIMVGKTDGVLDSKGETTKEITKDNYEGIKKDVLSSDGVADVTGGMVLKVEKALDMGVEIEIINGLKAGLFKRSLLGERGLGTIIRG